MIEFGKTLREAREAKGLSIAQLADLTRMPPSRIEQLEKEDFSKIPAAIYGRGFVRLYCEAVGLDPKPLSDEFTEIFNGNRDLEIKERAVEAPEPPAAKEDSRPSTLDSGAADAPVVAPVAAGSSTLDSRPSTLDSGAADASAFRLESETIEAPKPTPRFAAPQPTPEEPVAPVPPMTPPSPSLSRYAAPIREARPGLGVPPSVWRFGVLGLAALVVLALLVFGVRALYRATSGEPVEDETAECQPDDTAPAPKAQPAPKNTAAPKVQRTPQKVPALYLD